jgi:hypothetical protein
MPAPPDLRSTAALPRRRSARQGLRLLLAAVALTTGMQAANATDRPADTTLPGPAGHGSAAPAPASPATTVPQLVISFADSIPFHNIGIASDGVHYYTCNGGNASFGQINTYDLAGHFQHSTPCFLDLRAIFYNPADGQLYGKTFERNLYRIDPVTGVTNLVHGGIFNYEQSSPALSTGDQTLLEHEFGTIAFIDFASGQVKYFSAGFYTGGYPSSEAVATDGQRIFTWDENLVAVYDMGGGPLGTFTLPYGHYGFSLKFVNGLLFASDDGGGAAGTWYGYSVGGLPRFDHPPTPACETTLVVLAGHEVSFPVQASDPDSGAVVTLTALGLPNGATTTPPLPASGNPVGTTFHWTPSNANIGGLYVFFSAQTSTPASKVVTCGFNIQVLPDTTNHPPDCSHAAAAEPVLWPPNHKYRAVRVVGVSDPDGDPVTITVTGVTQDEPVNARGDGNTCPDAQIVNGQASVRAERTGTPGVPGNGRVYAINFIASDGKGGRCAGAVRVCVPHDLGDATCVDDGQRWNSLGPCNTENGLASDAFRLAVGGSTGTQVPITFSLAADGLVDLSAFDLAGRRLATLEHGWLPRGDYERAWDVGGRPNGLYFVRLRANGITLTRRVIAAR